MPTLRPIQPTLPPEREQEQQNADFDNPENIEAGLVPEGDEDHLDEPPDLFDHLDEDSDDEDEIVDNSEKPTPRQNPIWQSRGYNPRVHGNGWVNMALNGRIKLVTKDDIYLATLPFRTEAKSQENKIMIRLHEDKVDHDSLLMGTQPLALAARANDEDTPNYFEAMNSSNAEGFYEAMKKEIEQLESMDAWEEVPREEAEGKNILPSTWAFKRKRYPDGRVKPFGISIKTSSSIGA